MKLLARSPILLTVTCLIMMSMLSISGQTQNQYYSVQSYQDVYEEIEDYRSLMIESGDRFWDHRFELDFDFPIFDLYYDYLICDHTSFCYFEDDENGALRLLTFDYESDRVLDTVDLQSDVRYKLTTKDGEKALVLQFTKNRLQDDPSVDSFDSYINFQTWYFESGAVEIRFGESNLDNSPLYIPGEGFFHLVLNYGLRHAGPDVELQHPHKDIIITYNDLGSHEEFELVLDYNGGVGYLPPEGWVIRFENETIVSSTDIESAPEVSIYPNPSTDWLIVDSELDFDFYQIVDMSGRLIKDGVFIESLDVSRFESGLYMVYLYNGTSKMALKFLKQ